MRSAKVHFDELRHITKVGAYSHFGAVGAKREADGVCRVVRNREGVHIDVANGKMLAGLNGFDAAKALPKGFGKNALQRCHGGFGYVEWRFPEAEHLRQSIAVVGVFVSDEDCVEMVEISFHRGEARQRFAFTQASVYKDAGAFGFEQRQVARTTGSKNGNAQADGTFSLEKDNPHRETFKIMAERGSSVNAEETKKVDNR